jgi:hypothetical protein
LTELIVEVAKKANISSRAAKIAVRVMREGVAAMYEGVPVVAEPVRNHSRKGAAERGSSGFAGSATESRTISKAAFEPDARSRALLHGVNLAREDLKSSGGAYDLAQVQSLLGVSRQAIDKRVRQGSLLAVPGPRNRRHYPTVQFRQDGSVVEGLQKVRDVLPSRNPWVVLNFLVNPDPRLGEQRPIDLLKKGQVETVIESARRVDEQGA